MKILLIMSIIFSTLSFSKEKRKTVYKYKKYEKFDFDELVIEGGGESPGDLSISPRTGEKFKNILPYRKNFNSEIRKGIERVR